MPALHASAPTTRIWQIAPWMPSGRARRYGSGEGHVKEWQLPIARHTRNASRKCVVHCLPNGGVCIQPRSLECLASPLQPMASGDGRYVKKTARTVAFSATSVISEPRLTYQKGSVDPRPRPQCYLYFIPFHTRLTSRPQIGAAARSRRTVDAETRLRPQGT